MLYIKNKWLLPGGKAIYLGNIKFTIHEISPTISTFSPKFVHSKDHLSVVWSNL